MENSDMGKKLNFVQQWLESLFAGEGDIPDYEINSHTVNVLYAMAIQSERKAALAQIAIDDIEQKSKEYLAETARLKSVGEWLGLGMGELSPSARGHVQALATTSLALDLGDCSDTSLCSSLNELCCQRAKDEMMRKELQHKKDSLRDQLRQSLVKQAAQKSVLKEVTKELQSNQESNVAKQEKEAEFLRQKASQYSKLVTVMKEELTSLGYNNCISHGSLQEIAVEVEDLREQLRPLKSQLASYQNLPPDLDLVKVKIHEAKCCLTRLEEEFSKAVDLAHVEK